MSCDVPVALIVVTLKVPVLRVAIFPTVAVRVLNTAVIAFKTEAARLPVTVTFDAVVEAIVEEPVTSKF